MSWWLRPLQATASGAAITLGSTVVSCAFALQVEKSANRLFFWMVPHKYANVERAYGLTQEQLDSVRHLRTTTDKSTAETKSETTLTEPVFLSDVATSNKMEEENDVNKTLFSTSTTFGNTVGGTSIDLIRWKEPTRSSSSSSSSSTKVVVLNRRELTSAALTG